MNIDPNMTQCAKNIHDTLREMIKTEDELVNQRLMWLAQLQGLLFAAYAFLAGRSDRHRTILCVICVLGITVALSIFVATQAASMATNNLVRAWEDHKDIQGNACWQPDVQGARRPPYGDLGLFMWPGNLVPPLFALAWLVLLINALIPKPPFISQV